VSTIEPNAQSAHKQNKHDPNQVGFHCECAVRSFPVSTCSYPFFVFANSGNDKNTSNGTNGTNTTNLCLFRLFLRALFAPEMIAAFAAFVQ